MVVFVILGTIVHLKDREARRSLPLPARFGTLAAAVWLTGDPDLRYAIQQVPWDAKDEEIEKWFDGYRFVFDHETRRIIVQRDRQSALRNRVVLARKEEEGVLSPNETAIDSGRKRGSGSKSPR